MGSPTSSSWMSRLGNPMEEAHRVKRTRTVVEREQREREVEPAISLRAGHDVRVMKGSSERSYVQASCRRLAAGASAKAVRDESALSTVLAEEHGLAANFLETRVSGCGEVPYVHVAGGRVARRAWLRTWKKCATRQWNGRAKGQRAGGSSGHTCKPVGAGEWATRARTGQGSRVDTIHPGEHPTRNTKAYKQMHHRQKKT